MDTSKLIVVGVMACIFILPWVLRRVIPFFTGGARRTRLREGGVGARAVVTSIEQTGMTINDQPQCAIGVRIEPDGGSEFNATVTQVVSLVKIPLFQPGQRVTVRYDPAKPTDMVVLSVADGLIDESQHLLAKLNRPGAGEAASAIVTSFESDGVQVSGRSVFASLGVRVLPEGASPFEAIVSGVFQVSKLHKYQPGQTVRVRFDPADRSRVTFDLQRTEHTSG